MNVPEAEDPEIDDSIQAVDSVAKGAAPARRSITAAVRVGMPLARALGEWCRFDEFPHFMKGPENANKVDGGRMVWRIHFDEAWVPWDAEVMPVHADDGIFWSNQTAARPCPNWGQVSFVPETPTTTRIHIACEFSPLPGQRWLEENMEELADRLRRGLASFHDAVSRCGDASDGYRRAEDRRRDGWLVLLPAERQARQAESDL